MDEVLNKNLKKLLSCEKDGLMYLLDKSDEVSWSEFVSPEGIEIKFGDANFEFLYGIKSGEILCFEGSSMYEELYGTNEVSNGGLEIELVRSPEKLDIKILGYGVLAENMVPIARIALDDSVKLFNKFQEYAPEKHGGE